MDIESLQSLVLHPNWKYAKGLLVFPHFKSSQKVRLTTVERDSNIWLPDLEDPVTLAYLHHLYTINNGSVRQEGGLWVSSHGVTGEDLAEVVLVSFIKAR